MKSILIGAGESCLENSYGIESLHHSPSFSIMHVIIHAPFSIILHHSSSIIVSFIASFYIINVIILHFFQLFGDFNEDGTPVANSPLNEEAHTFIPSLDAGEQHAGHDQRDLQHNSEVESDGDGANS